MSSSTPAVWDLRALADPELRSLPSLRAVIEQLERADHVPDDLAAAFRGSVV